MKFAIVTLLVMTSAAATVAVAQDGGGHGPPKSSIIVVPQIPVPTTASPTGTAQKFFQPASELASMTR